MDSGWLLYEAADGAKYEGSLGEVDPALSVICIAIASEQSDFLMVTQGNNVNLDEVSGSSVPKIQRR